MRSFDREFNKNLIKSMGGHLFLLAFGMILGKGIERFLKSNDLEIIHSSIRVDVVGMPKFTIQELRQLQVKQIAEPISSSTSIPDSKATGSEDSVKEIEKKSEDLQDKINKDDLVIEKQSKKTNSFLNLLQDYSKKKISPSKKERIKKDHLNHSNLDSLVIEGNRISKGSSLVGDFTDTENSEFSAYVQNLPSMIRPYWKLPSYLMDKDLRCRIKIYLSKDGKLLKLEIKESSGVSEFDSRAEMAIRESRFPPPTEEVGARLVNSGIILGFPI